MQSYVLMIEDDHDDRYLTQEVMEELGIHVPIHFLDDASYLETYLAENSLPTLILMDYSTFPENCHSVLRLLKQNDSFKNIPVIVLSENNLPQYKNECYRLGANTFIKKPASMKDTKDKIASFFHYWFAVAEV